MKKDLIVSIILTLLFLPYFQNNAENKITTEYSINKTTPTISVSDNEYGIETDNFNIEEGEISANLFISNLFAKYNVSNDLSSKILAKSKNIFDVRKIQKGKKYKVFLSKDRRKQVKYIVYEQSPDKYVVFDFNDSTNVYIGEKEIRTELKTASGIITSSLWESMTENGINPLLANDLSEIYAWTIDFFGLQDGDKFKIIYQAKFVDTIQIGNGEIKAAYFEHYQKDIYAIPFYQDSTWSYFNIDGESLRKAFLKAPLKYSHISSGFSGSRLHPILKIYRPHYGVDYSAPSGTPVQTIGDGVVIEANYGSQSGNMLKIKHNGVYTTGYLHLSKFAEGIAVGSKVTQGEVIGYVGSTGLSTGPHLDFRVWMNGEPIDPLKIDAPPVDPISEANKATFKKIADFIIDNLNKIEYNYGLETK